MLLSICALTSSLALYSLPQEMQVIHGHGKLGESSGQLDVTTSNQAILNWKQFSIGEGERVQFHQPTSSSVVLNRVKGGDVSQILGQLQANGKVYLFNPNGIVIGKNGVIKTAGFIASTLDVSDADFLAGQEMLFSGESKEVIINYGQIEAVDGSVTLIGRVVDNQGSLKAGKVSLLAAQEILLKPHDNALLTIRPESSGTLSHEGQIEALSVELQAAGQAYAFGINVRGSITALNPVTQNGKVFLKADTISFHATSNLRADTAHIETTARPLYSHGKVDVASLNIDAFKLMNTGELQGRDSVTIKAQAGYIETLSGKISGGTISIQSGAGLYTSGSITGTTIKIDAQDVVLSSATLNGEIVNIGETARTTRLSGNTYLNVKEGGKINIWSEEKTICHGVALAPGGTIEVSSRGELYSGADLRAGHVVLDPKNIVISSVTGIYPQYELIDPNSGGGSGFGTAVTPLSGYVVVTKPLDNFVAASSGAVYVYETLTAALVSTLTGSQANDQVGSGGAARIPSSITASSVTAAILSPLWNNGGVTQAGAFTNLIATAAVSGTVSTSNSLVGTTINDQVGNSGAVSFLDVNYAVRSSVWNNGAATQAGAVTWVNQATGITGTLSSANSLVGSTTNDQIGSGGVIPLLAGNYVVLSPLWNNGAAVDAGAVTWGSSTAGVSGTISATNSLVGSTTGDVVGTLTGFVRLSNGNYVCAAPLWDNGATTNVGAVTFGNGATGVVGAVSASNSLIGTISGDQVGSAGVVQLTNSNYVVRSPVWRNGAATLAGAVTWGSGTTGITGAVTIGNSLVGTQASDNVGGTVVSPLTNGNYVVVSGGWNNGAVVDVGATTWQDGTGAGPFGAVSTSNSLVGSTANDGVSLGIAGLTNGHYVRNNVTWDNGAVANAGAATWCNGTTGAPFGTVTAGNSLVGSTANDNVGTVITLLTNGNYVVRSPNWDAVGPAVVNVGAFTWGNGSTAGPRLVGTVSASNSLVGSLAGDGVTSAAAALSNGNYVARLATWNGSRGSITWGDGTTGITGTISSSNSYVGATANDQVGSGLLVAFSTGNYVVASPLWNNGAATTAGAITWGNGLGGTTGTISSSNSLVGTTTGDQVGTAITTLTVGTIAYVTRTSTWDNGAVVDAGAVTWASAATGITGTVSSLNSLVGTQANDRVGNVANQALITGGYIVNSTLWNGSRGAITFGPANGGVSGPLTPQNSVTGQAASAGLQTLGTPVTSTLEFLASFLTEGTGKVRVGLESLDQITFARAEAQTMTLAPSTLEATLNAGTAVTLQANNDITVSSPITGTTGDLILSAGRSVLLNANISTGSGDLTVTANDLLASGVVDADRDAGNATIAVANGVTLSTSAGSITLSLLDGAGKTNSGSGDLTVGDGATLLSTGAGSINLFAQQNNIVLGNNTLLQTENGNLQLTAGVSIIGSGPVTLQTIGSGQLILLSDNLFPTAPGFGIGCINLPLATLATGGGKLLIYTSNRDLNTLPSTINGVAFAAGPLFVDTATEKWATYYPSSSGFPFTIFYKNGGSATTTVDLHGLIIGVVDPFHRWLNPWFDDLYFSCDPYPPYLTPKGLRLRLPSLIRP